MQPFLTRVQEPPPQWLVWFLCMLGGLSALMTVVWFVYGDVWAGLLNLCGAVLVLLVTLRRFPSASLRSLGIILVLLAWSACLLMTLLEP